MIAILKLDWSITSPEERLKCVEEILKEEPEPNEARLELMGTYLTEGMKKQILTENRLATINKRETSLEGLFDTGEDSMYNLVTENNKNVIFKPKISITKQDLEEIPPLQQKRESITFWENQLKKASGRTALIIKQTIIELRKDQYIIKNAYRQPVKLTSITRNLGNYIALPSSEWIEDDEVCFTGVSLCDEQIIEQILCNYQQLRLKSEGKFLGDTWYLMEDFDHVYEQALAQYPMYRRIVEYKMDALSNSDIRSRISDEFGFSHSIEYLSSLWHNKIPRLIAQQAQENFLMWYYTNAAKGHWKKCTRCGQVKLAHNHFFSINKTSKDGFYSICKQCRNKRSDK